MNNPTTYLGHTLTWGKGRQLKTFGANTYTYNANGIRTGKTVGGVSHTYTLDGTKILRETWGDHTLIPLYDNEESVCGIIYNGEPYYFVKNLQGDVIAIVNKDAATVARYTYDAWGAIVSIKDASGADLSDNASHIANINPFRYRCYYYDTEIGFYYLQSRYYDPIVGRFINADEPFYIAPYQKSTGLNLYAYCQNNIVNMFDPFGNWVLSIGIEGQAAFILGIYAGFAVNLDGYWNISITYAIGFAIINNGSVYIQGYIAYYINKNKTSQLKGWGVSTGASFSMGLHFSAGGTVDIGFDGNTGGNLNIGYGSGISVIPVPSFQTRVGYTGTLCTIKLLDALKNWKNKKKKTYSKFGIKITVTKYENYIKIYIKAFKKTIYI